MAWPFTQQRGAVFPNATQILERITQQRTDSNAHVTRSRALSHSAVFACRRLRADLISSMPLYMFRKLGTGQTIEIPVTQPVLLAPDGVWPMSDYLYASQNDLDDYGNAFALIRAVDVNGRPTLLEPLDVSKVTVSVRDSVTKYKVDSHEYDPWVPTQRAVVGQILHEREFPVSGTPVGLSPLAYAAAAVNGYLSAQQFAQNWFSGTTIPSGVLRNSKKQLSPEEAMGMKTKFRSSIAAGDVFVTGNDWDYSMINAPSASSSFLDEMKYGIADICRFYGVPADMIDAESSTGSITYANVTQRNLQLLIMNLGPVKKRREQALSQLTPKPWTVELDADSVVLKMDTASRYAAYQTAITTRILAPSEARELEKREPFTDSQKQEFVDLFKTVRVTETAVAPDAASVDLNGKGAPNTEPIPEAEPVK